LKKNRIVNCGSGNPRLGQRAYGGEQLHSAVSPRGRQRFVKHIAKTAAGCEHHHRAEHLRQLGWSSGAGKKTQRGPYWSWRKLYREKKPVPWSG